MASCPRFTWKLADYRMNRTVAHGDEPSSDKAKAALVAAVRRAGGWRAGFSGGVTRASGGGWFIRMERLPTGSWGYEWEEWEPAL